MNAAIAERTDVAPTPALAAREHYCASCGRYLATTHAPAAGTERFAVRVYCPTCKLWRRAVHEQGRMPAGGRRVE